MAAIATVALVACSDDKGGAGNDVPTTVAEAATTAPTTAAPTTTAKPPTVVSVKTQPGTGTGFEGAKADVKLVDCESAGGSWTATGSVTNPTAAAANYRIYVAFIDATSDTRGLVEVDVDALAAGASKDWSGELALAEPDLTCVLRVERTAA